MSVQERLELGLPVSDEEMASIPCGCHECSERPQSGHFACDAVEDFYIAAEEAGLIVRAYDDGRWRWFKTDR